MKRIYKSTKEKKISGVCGGIAEYFGIDPAIVRLAAIALVMLGGGGVLAYIIASIVIPDDPGYSQSYEEDRNYSREMTDRSAARRAAAEQAVQESEADNSAETSVPGTDWFAGEAPVMGSVQMFADEEPADNGYAGDDDTEKTPEQRCPVIHSRY